YVWTRSTWNCFLRSFAAANSASIRLNNLLTSVMFHLLRRMRVRVACEKASSCEVRRDLCEIQKDEFQIGVPISVQFISSWRRAPAVCAVNSPPPHWSE